MEFVILLPIIIMILFIVIDFAFIFYNKNSLEGVMEEVSLYQQNGKSYDEIKEILGFDIDHSFLNCKKELKQYGYEVEKISMKEKSVTFAKIV